MRRALVCLLVIVLLAVVWLSLQMAGSRIYHFDECQNVYSAALHTAGRGGTSSVGFDLFQIGILSWAVGAAANSIDMYQYCRYLMLELFWANILLLACCAGVRLFSAAGLAAVIGAATLAPFWDFGWEIRRENLILTGLLLIWCLLRVRPAGLQSFALAGGIAAGLQFVAFKAFLFTVPVSGLAYLLIRSKPRKIWWKPILAWLGGAAGVFAIVRVTLGFMGLWEPYLAHSHDFVFEPELGRRLPSWATLSALLVQAPLFFALLGAALVAVLMRESKDKPLSPEVQTILPEVLLFGIILAASLLRPVPYPYSVLYLVPFGFLVAFRYARELWKDLVANRVVASFIVPVLVFTHLVPFWLSITQQSRSKNFRQEQLMRVSEKLTDPVKDRVFDGVGLMATRSGIHSRWLLRNADSSRASQGSKLSVREMLAANPPAVLIPSHRTDCLPVEDHEFIREHYVRLADDYWLLGKVLPPGGAAFEIIHPGRYRISSLETSDLAGTYPEGMIAFFCPERTEVLRGTLDGQTLPNQPVYLAAGWHWIECETDCQATVVWTGPRSDRPHRLHRGDHQRLFKSGY